MNLFSSIPRRRSCRKYQPQPLSREIFCQMEHALEEFLPLYPGLPVSYRFTQKVKGPFHIEAPHYLIIKGIGAPGELENAGFFFQQLVLWLDAMELGCVWLGASKDAQSGDTHGDIAAIAFGHSQEPVHRSREQFRRKAIEKLTNVPEDACVQAARLAPSGMNTQPWYFHRQGQQMLLYQQKLRPPLSFFYKLSDVDMGISLCHYALACKALGRSFHFSRETALPSRPGYRPFGIIQSFLAGK